MATKSSLNQSVPHSTSPERFKEICLRVGGESCKETLATLDYLFNPETFLDRSPNGVSLIKQYLTGGASYETFKNRLKAFDNSSTCGLVWNVNYVAYRCRTCALSPCMSICADCFKNGDHKGHDFNMFRSGAGGACDCGDEHVMSAKGFCKSHGCKKQHDKMNQPPDELTKCCDVILAHLLYCLLQAFRKLYSSLDFKLPTNRHHLATILNDLNSYIELMNELCSLGTPLRKIFVDYIINEEFYSKKIQSESLPKSASSLSSADQPKTLRFKARAQLDHDDDDNEDDDDDEDDDDLSEVIICPQNSAHNHSIYTKALSMHEAIKVPSIFRHIEDQIRLLTNKSIVDELLFWCIRFEFPEPLVKFLLSLLPDLRYKMHFIRSFVSQYSYISVLLLQSKSEQLSSRVVHISVQLFSNEAIALKALDECHLLPILLSTLHNMIVTSGIESEETRETLLIRCKLEDEVHNKHRVVDPDHPILQENLYWLAISDLVNLLTHKRIAYEFMYKNELIILWFELITYFQAMNLNVRKFGEHVQQEQPTYFSSFSAELEFCSSVMWSLIQHLNNSTQQENIELTQKLTKLMFDSLKRWLEAIGITKTLTTKRPNYKHLTFHLPLHRYLSCITYNAICAQTMSFDSLLDAYFEGSSHEDKQSLLVGILAHPLQLQIGFYEIHANMWVRNGMQMKGQAMTYVQNHFCTSFSDADLFLLQMLAAKLDSDVFIGAYFERFHILKWLRKSVYERHRSIQEQTSKSRKSGSSPKDGDANNDYDDDDDEDDELDIEYESKFKEKIEHIGQDDLEPAHEIAMLVGALTVLAQLFMTKPNLRLKSYFLTRSEIVYILAVADRTFSQVEENLPDICSLSVAKRFISPILTQVSDYLQPTLDLSITNLKQGRYKPKDSIWLSEYDPLYIILRSVKRREFQESFDRYTQVVEKKLQQTKLKKNIWPPFRLPDFELKNLNVEEIQSDQASAMQIDEEFDLKKEIEENDQLDKALDSRWNLLNTKLIHSIFLTILYEHNYINSVTEKVLYFVIYLLELAVHRAQKVKNLPKQESQKSEQSIFDEYNYQTWFRGNDLVENLCTYVPFMTCEVSMRKEVDCSSATAMELGDEQQCPKVPPLKKRCSGLSAAFRTASNKEVNRNNESNKYSKKLKKGYTCESILSLLVKIVYASKKTEYEQNRKKLTDNETASANQPFSLDYDFLRTKNLDNDFYESRIGDESDFIVNLLEQAAQLDRKCNLIINKTLETLNSVRKQQHQASVDSNLDETDMLQTQSTSPNNNAQATSKTEQNHAPLKSSPSNEDDLKDKKQKAKARQQKLLAQMSTNQKAFLSNPNNKLDVDAFNQLSQSLPDTTPIQIQPKAGDSINILASSNDSNQPTTSSTLNLESDSIVNEEAKCSSLIESTKIDEIYDCCICRQSSVATLERPIGMVALIQSTSILGQRESSNVLNSTKKLPLTEDCDYKDLNTDTLCCKQEEKRMKNLREAFSIDSCKYSINIGWKGGVYAQMCGHYLHFDCYNSYKQTLDEQLNHLSRTSNLEYTCPLCRQISNCVLPVAPVATNQLKKSHSSTSFDQTKHTTQSPGPLYIGSSLSNSPAKIWILSSLAKTNSSLANGFNNSLERLNNINNSSNSQQTTAKPKNPSDVTSELQKEAFEKFMASNIVYNAVYENILDLLKARPFSNQDLSSKILTQCKNDALTVITLSTPIEFRYIDHSTTISNPALYRTESPVDDDIAMFTTSGLRTQLEIDLMLLLRQTSQQALGDSNLHMSISFNFKKKRACFIPLFDVISTHCRLMCHEFKPHVKQWLMLISPTLWKYLTAFDSKLNIDDADLNTEMEDEHQLESKSININKAQEVPILLRDPIAILLLLISNLPVNLDKSYFNCIVSNVFNLVFVQSAIDLCRQFDEEEKNIWANSASGDQNSSNLEFNDYVASLINYLKSTNVFQKQENNTQYLKTIWTKESAKNYVERKCMHFLKITSLLQAYLYDQEISNSSINNFESLIKFLNINYNYEVVASEKLQNVAMIGAKTNLLKWCSTKPNETIYAWLDDLLKANNTHREQVQNLLNLSFDLYNFPQLLELPKLYSDLFSYYLVKKCEFCSKVPKETAICLVCGAQLCYKSQYCCDSLKEFNKRHLNQCGAGTLVLLNINSTYVFIMRNKRCAAWASLYLDEHGEEDRDLRRGKPLFLNEQRYNLLKSSWYSHTFDYQSLKWYNSSLLIY